MISWATIWLIVEKQDKAVSKRSVAFLPLAGVRDCCTSRSHFVSVLSEWQVELLSVIEAQINVLRVTHEGWHKLLGWWRLDLWQWTELGLCDGVGAFNMPWHVVVWTDTSNFVVLCLPSLGNSVEYFFCVLEVGSFLLLICRCSS